MRRILFLSVLLLATAAGPIAQPALPAHFQSLADVSSLIVTGRVAGTTVQADAGFIYTYVSVDVADVLKGPARTADDRRQAVGRNAADPRPLHRRPGPVQRRRRGAAVPDRAAARWHAADGPAGRGQVDAAAQPADRRANRRLGQRPGGLRRCGQALRRRLGAGDRAVRRRAARAEPVGDTGLHDDSAERGRSGSLAPGRRPREHPHRLSGRRPHGAPGRRQGPLERRQHDPAVRTRQFRRPTVQQLLCLRRQPHGQVLLERPVPGVSGRRHQLFGVGGGFFTPGFQKTVNGVTFNAFVQGLAILNNVGPHTQNNACMEDAIGHVLGHALGLGHSASDTALNARRCAPAAAAAHGLGTDDVDGIRFIYPGIPSGGTPARADGHHQHGDARHRPAAVDAGPDRRTAAALHRHRAVVRPGPSSRR